MSYVTVENWCPVLDSRLLEAYWSNWPFMSNKNYIKRLFRSLGTRIREFRFRNEPGEIVAMGYDEMADDYGNWTLRHERADRDKYTNILFANLAEGSELLELGCGPGDPTTKSLSQRFAVTANDISEGCLALARKNAPNAKFVLSDMTELEFPADRFDAVVAYYAFHHVPRDRYEPLINNISRWLKSGGLFMAAFYPYDVDNLVTDDWHGSTMYWSSFEEEPTLQLIANAEFEIVEQSKESAIEDGKETTFLWVLARRK